MLKVLFKILHVLSVDSVEYLVLAYVVCDALAHVNLWMMVVTVSHLVMSVLCCCGVRGVHELLSQTEKKSHAFTSCYCSIHNILNFVEQMAGVRNNVISV
jgi:hypothetical protein